MKINNESIKDYLTAAAQMITPDMDDDEITALESVILPLKDELPAAFGHLALVHEMAFGKPLQETTPQIPLNQQYGVDNRYNL